MMSFLCRWRYNVSAQRADGTFIESPSYATAEHNMHVLLPRLPKRFNLVIVHESSSATLAARHSWQFDGVRTGKALEANRWRPTSLRFKLITEWPASHAVDSENATVRQRGHSKSQQIAINALDYRNVIATAPPASAALEFNEVEAESELL